MPLRPLPSLPALRWQSLGARSQALVAAMAISGSIVLAADDPAALAQFYGELLQVEPQRGLSTSHWRVRWPAGGWLEIYAPSRSRPQPRQRGRLALCLQQKVESTDTAALLNSWIEAALGLGASLLDPPRQEPFGAEAWLLDPEGNRLLLLVRS
jgi:predicted enzyme related to lactoylglutathione lyase